MARAVVVPGDPSRPPHPVLAVLAYVGSPKCLLGRGFLFHCAHLLAIAFGLAIIRCKTHDEENLHKARRLEAPSVGAFWFLVPDYPDTCMVPGLSVTIWAELIVDGICVGQCGAQLLYQSRSVECNECFLVPWDMSSRYVVVLKWIII